MRMKLVPLLLMFVIIGGVAATAAPSAYDLEIAKGPVEITYYQCGDPPADSAAVWAAINKILKEKINTTVKLVPISWSDYQTKYQLIFNSGENFDAAFGANWLAYGGLATKCAFLPITDDMLRKYAPNTGALHLGPFAKSDKSDWVGGTRYMLGAMPTEVRPFVAIVRADLAQKYGITKLDTFNDLYAYIKAIGTKEQGMTALMDVGAGIGDTARWFQGWASSNGWGSLGSSNRRALSLDASGSKVIVPAAQALYLDYAQKQDELQALGCISKSANSNKTNTQPAFQAGQTPIQITSSVDGEFSRTLSQHPEFRLAVVDFSKNVKPLGKPMNGSVSGYVIHATSAHPERTLMVLDMLQGDKQVTQLLTYGIPGVHYQPVGDNKFKALPGSDKTFPAEGTCPWGVTDFRYKLYNESSPQAWLDVIKGATARATGLPSDGFVFDESAVSNEIAAVNSICATYGPLVDTGLTGDYKAKVAEFNAKLKQAGIDKIVAEAQKQLDKFIATNK